MMIPAFTPHALQTTGLELLAQLSRWQRLGDGLRHSRSTVELADLVPYLIAAIVIGMGAWAVRYWIRRNDTSLVCNDPCKLFRELCLAHNLSSTDQRLLRKLGDASNLQHPADVFLTPSVFEQSNLPPALQPQQRAVQSLQKRLF